MNINVSYLQSRFDLFNKKFFNNILPKIDIKISRTKKTFGDFIYINNGNIPLSIRISNYYDRNSLEIDETLIHEMIHYYICFKKIKDNKSHGFYFQHYADKIKLESKGKYNITATSKSEAPIRNKKIFKIFYFVYRNTKCFARISNNFNYKYYIKKYNLIDPRIIFSSMDELDKLTECRSKLSFYSENTLLNKLIA